MSATLILLLLSAHTAQPVSWWRHMEAVWEECASEFVEKSALAEPTVSAGDLADAALGDCQGLLRRFHRERIPSRSDEEVRDAMARVAVPLRQRTVSEIIGIRRRAREGTKGDSDAAEKTSE